MSEIIEYAFYVEGDPPREVDGAEVVGVERVFGGWHKLVLRLPKDKIPLIASRLRKTGLRLAKSANY